MIAALPVRVPVIRGFSVDCSSEYSLADSVNTHVRPVDETLKLRWTPANVIDALHIFVGQRLHDRTHAADRLVDHPAMTRAKRTHQLRIVCDQSFRHFEAVAPNELRLVRLREVGTHRRDTIHDAGRREL